MDKTHLILVSIISLIIFIYSLGIQTFGGYTIFILLIVGIIFYFMSEEILKLIAQKANIFWTIGMVILGIIILVLAYGINSILENKQKIDQQWPQYKCKPYIIPFAGWAIGPSGTSPTDNFMDCLWTINKNFFDVLISPFVSMFELILSILKGFTQDIQNIRKMITYIRDSIEEIAEDVYQKIYDAYARIAYLFKKLLTIFDKLFDVFKDLFDVLIYTFYTFASMWNGDIGGVARFFCFDGKNLIKMNNGDFKYIEDIKIGDSLDDDNEVTGIFKFNSKYVKMYNYCGVIVSGEHLIQENNEWKRINNSENAIPLYDYDEKFIYCLTTKNSNIKIGSYIFKDYYETHNKYINSIIYKIIEDYLNMKSIPSDLNNYEYRENIYNGFHRNTKIIMKNNKEEYIKRLKLGHKTLYGKIIGKMKFRVKNITLYKYKNNWMTGNTLVYSDKIWKPIYKIYDKKIKNYSGNLYNIIVENNNLLIGNNFFKDFEQTDDKNINNFIDKFILNYLNN